MSPIQGLPPASPERAHPRHLLRSILVVMAFFGLDKVTGFGKLLLMTRAFGTGPEADAFTAANQLPELMLAMMAGGAITMAFIPVYSASRLRHPGQAASLANTLFTLTLLGVGVVCALLAWRAPWIARALLVPDFPPEQQRLTGELMRVVLFSAFLLAVGGVFTGLLHAHQHFWIPALGRVLIDLGQIGGLVFLAPIWGIHGVAWGSVLGAALVVSAQLLALWHHRLRLRLELALRLEELREMFRLIGPRVVTMGAFQAVDLVTIRLGSRLPEGAIAALFYALLAMVYMPRSLFATAVIQVLFPTLADQYNRGDLPGLRRTTTWGLQAVMALIAGAAVGLVALGPSAVALFFQRGAFGPESTALVYSLMVILSLRLVSEALADVLALPFYARHDTATPMWVTLGWMGMQVGLSYLLVDRWGVQGLAWAASLSMVAMAGAMAWLCQSRLRGLEMGALLRTGGRLAVACGAMGMTVQAVQGWGWPPLLAVPTAVVLGAGVFWGGYTLLGGDELGWVWQRLVRRPTTPPEDR